jgi:Ca2+-binding EF-hand superfamily protein
LVSTNSKTGKIDFSKDTIRAYTEVFSRMDLDGDGYLNKTEMDQFMTLTEGSIMTDNAFQWLLQNFEKHETPGLSLSGFIKAQLFVFEKTESNEDKLLNEFKLFGYDSNLNHYSDKMAALVVHSDVSDYKIETHSFDENAFEEANELYIKAYGQCTPMEEGRIKLYKHRSGYYGLSFLVENNHPTAPLVFILDCSTSVNVCSHRGSLNHEETIPPGGDVVMHHLMPKSNDTSSWTWSYSASYMFDD